MKHLLQYWDSVEKQMGDQKIILCLDFDGTLSAIAPTPEMAVFSEENREIVEALGRNPRCSLAIVSGRALADVKDKVGIENIMYIGNHGLEAEGPQFRFESLAPPQDKQTMAQLKRDLVFELDGVDGAFVEDKGLTLSVHYRLAHIEDEPMIQKIVLKTCHPYLAQKKIHLWEGKKVLEIRPSLDWDKGKAVLWLLERERKAEGQEVFPIYVGDDVTDEDAFRALQGKGLGIMVGLSDLSDAQYYLNGPDEVTDFLRHLLEYINQRTLAQGRA